MERRILLVDDEAYANKCKKILQYLEQRETSYDIAVTLEEAKEKVLSVSYNGVILDMYFPSKEGEEAVLSADKFLEFLSEQGKQIPVVIYSTSMDPIKHKLVIANTNPIDFQKLSKVENLINYETSKDTNNEEHEKER